MILRTAKTVTVTVTTLMEKLKPKTSATERSFPIQNQLRSIIYTPRVKTMQIMKTTVKTVKTVTTVKTVKTVKTIVLATLYVGLMRPKPVALPAAIPKTLMILIAIIILP